jgi:archaemetzincin
MPRRDAIVLWWIGADTADHGLLHVISRGLAREVGLTVTTRPDRLRPDHTFDAARGQHSSTGILRWLVQHVPPRATRLLALTDVDLFIPVLTFVYGEAQMNGRVAVVSTARFGAGDPGLLPARVVKTCVHEIGHTFGLVHCDNDTDGAACVMRRSTSVAHVDAKSAAFCPDCRTRLREALVLEEMAS